MDPVINFLSKHWLIIIAIGAAVAAVWATVKFKIPSIEKRLEQIEKMNLVTADYCKEHQAQCRQAICGKIDIMQRQLREMDRERNQARNEFQIELRKISNFMGRVEQFMQNISQG